VMGEFTIANLAQFHTFPIFIQFIGESDPYQASAVTLVSFGITWLAMSSLLFIGRKRGGSTTQIAGAR
jgi:putative spermidine/putrescine transport system permease protein